MKIKVKVEQVLQRWPQSRDSDKWLIMKIWHDGGLVLTAEQRELLMSLPTPESITRERRKFQEQGKYLGSPEVMRQRRIKSAVVQQNAPTASPERLGRLINENEQPKQEQQNEKATTENLGLFQDGEIPTPPVRRPNGYDVDRPTNRWR